MAILRVVDRQVGERRLVSVSWLDGVPLTHETFVSLPVDGAESEKVRWYLEDYAEFPTDPAPALARDTEELLATVGRQLFERVFAERGAVKLWAKAEDDLAEVRVEIDTDPSDVPGVAWELLRNPDTDQAVALATAEFVRTHHQTARAVQLPSPTDEPLRVLLVICRPGGREDVPFRSVASRLVRSGVDRLTGLDLRVLRPPTFARLAQVLRAAKEAGQPFHIVHFDGHGAFLDASKLDDETAAVSALTFGPAGRPGRHGYLLFEEPEVPSGQRLVDGPMLAALLMETQVAVLVLNACRSAYAEAPAAPDPTAGVHERIRACGSLSAEIADQGVPGVVAMRYNVYVDTAARFVEDLYQQLAAGRALGAAVSDARKALAADPQRRIGATPVALQDWLVPTVYEPQPLFLRTAGADTSMAAERPVDVPAAPDIGFIGRDEALLALDRAFDADPVVLLHALAGSGKTTTAAEFARWYTATGGLDGGVVLWTSFEHHTPLERVLDGMGPLAVAVGVPWAAITDPAERRSVVLRILAAVPVLWVWDNVEPVTGFPAGTPSAWTGDEQAELRTFLRDLATAARAKVLLTSRRDEHGWLGDLPRRIRLAPMPMRERLQLTHALVRRLSGTPRGDEIDWHRLLRFTGGNPLTITVTVRQAVLREQVTTTEQVKAFITRIESGASTLEPAENVELGRSQSLAASLAYGFNHAFTPPEHAQLALLHLFRDSVNTANMRSMGHPPIAGDDAVSALANTDGDTLNALLTRAAELGLLTRYDSGSYGIHPALPWYFTAQYDKHHPALDTRAQAERAYTRAISASGTYYFLEVENGRAQRVLPSLQRDEENLRHALELARNHHIPGVRGAIGCLQALSKLLTLTGRHTEWARLVASVEEDYIEPATDQPRPGSDSEDYMVVTAYRVRNAVDRSDWSSAARLQRLVVAIAEEGAAPHLGVPIERLDADTQGSIIYNLASSKCILGRILREQEDAYCLTHLHTAYDLAASIGQTALQSTCANQLGIAYRRLQDVRDLEQAQYWTERELELASTDATGRSTAYISLGHIAAERARIAARSGTSRTELAALIHTIHDNYQKALDLTPSDHHEYLAVGHRSMGSFYSSIGGTSEALYHYQKALAHSETHGDIYGAGQTRYNMAILHSRTGRVADALLYARAAFGNSQQVGPGAADLALGAEALIHQLEHRLTTPPS